ncbi:MAG TPA: hydroxyisourate hydrolase [Candidatus Limnocylindria bacterium]|nr:hydroxyisourate hydrolase [Candidatus Limnocylindria bacterium]
MAERAPTISTHVLDTARGRPAVGVKVSLFRLAEDGRPVRLTQSITDADGRIADLLERPLQAGDYRLRFDAADDAAFFRTMALDFRVTDTSRSYHLPLLLAPFSMTVYRGS